MDRTRSGLALTATLLAVPGATLLGALVFFAGGGALMAFAVYALGGALILVMLLVAVLVEAAPARRIVRAARRHWRRRPAHA